MFSGGVDYQRRLVEAHSEISKWTTIFTNRRERGVGVPSYDFKVTPEYTTDDTQRQRHLKANYTKPILKCDENGVPEDLKGIDPKELSEGLIFGLSHLSFKISGPGSETFIKFLQCDKPLKYREYNCPCKSSPEGIQVPAEWGCNSCEYGSNKGPPKRNAYKKGISEGADTNKKRARNPSGQVDYDWDFYEEKSKMNPKNSQEKKTFNDDWGWSFDPYIDYDKAGQGCQCNCGVVDPDCKSGFCDSYDKKRKLSFAETIKIGDEKNFMESHESRRLDGNNVFDKSKICQYFVDGIPYFEENNDNENALCTPYSYEGHEKFLLFGWEKSWDEECRFHAAGTFTKYAMFPPFLFLTLAIISSLMSLTKDGTIPACPGGGTCCACCCFDGGMCCAIPSIFLFFLGPIVWVAYFPNTLVTEMYAKDVGLACNYSSSFILACLGFPFVVLGCLLRCCLPKRRNIEISPSNEDDDDDEVLYEPRRGHRDGFYM